MLGEAFAETVGDIISDKIIRCELAAVFDLKRTSINVLS
jgi:hypothetical protein